MMLFRRRRFPFIVIALLFRCSIHNRDHSRTFAFAPPTVRLTKVPGMQLKTVTRPFVCHQPLRMVAMPSKNDGKKQEDIQASPSPFMERVEQAERLEIAEFAAIGVWLAALSSFIFVNEFVGPWPHKIMDAVPGNIWLVLHYLGGMMFAGGIIMTTAIEWLVASQKDESVLKFWFTKVPELDAFMVLPGLTMAMIAGTGVSIDHYGGLGKTPGHIENVFWTLVVFAIWWALTDLTTQPKAAAAIEQWSKDADKEEKDIPRIVHLRKISNVVSCLFIVALYGIMTLKPGLYK